MARTPRSLQVGRANLEASIALIPQRYRQGIENGQWADAASTQQAEQNWVAGVQKAVTNNSRVQGIRRAGDNAWREGALSKGVAVIGERIRANLGKWEENFGRVYSAVLPKIAALPPKGPDAMANIDARLKPTVKAFQDAKGRR